MEWSISITGLCGFIAVMFVLFSKIIPNCENFLLGSALISTIVSIVPWAVFVSLVIIKFVGIVSEYVDIITKYLGIGLEFFGRHLSLLGDAFFYLNGNKKRLEE